MSKIKKKNTHLPYRPVGRPLIVDEIVLQKLEYAFAMGCTDLEACVYANIGKSTLYTYQQENPDFLERKEELKEKPFLEARTTIFDNLHTPEMAKWYLERKKKKEFGQAMEMDMNLTTSKIISIDE